MRRLALVVALILAGCTESPEEARRKTADAILCGGGTAAGLLMLKACEDTKDPLAYVDCAVAIGGVENACVRHRERVRKGIR